MQTAEGFVFVRPGLHLYYRTVGNGPEVVLIPNANWLAELLAPLSQGRTLLFYDPRSRGRSSTVSESRQLSLEADVEDLESVRRYFGADRISLLGSSYHAAITASYAIENPDRVDRMVLACPITPRIPGEWAQELPSPEILIVPPGVPQLEALRQRQVDRTDPVAFCRAWFAQFLLPAQISEPAAIERFPLADIASFPNEWPQHTMPLYFRDIVPKMGRWDFRPQLSRLKAPLLVIQGTDDLVPVQASEEWAAWAPDARFLAIEAAGHHPYLEKPDEFFPAVETFFSGRWPLGAETIRRVA